MGCTVFYYLYVYSGATLNWHYICFDEWCERVDVEQHGSTETNVKFACCVRDPDSAGAEFDDDDCDSASGWRPIDVEDAFAARVCWSTTEFGSCGARASVAGSDGTSVSGRYTGNSTCYCEHDYYDCDDDCCSNGRICTSPTSSHSPSQMIFY